MLCVPLPPENRTRLIFVLVPGSGAPCRGRTGSGDVVVGAGMGVSQKSLDRVGVRRGINSHCFRQRHKRGGQDFQTQLSGKGDDRQKIEFPRRMPLLRRLLTESGQKAAQRFRLETKKPVSLSPSSGIRSPSRA